MAKNASLEDAKQAETILEGKEYAVSFNPMHFCNYRYYYSLAY